MKEQCFPTETFSLSFNSFLVQLKEFRSYESGLISLLKSYYLHYGRVRRILTKNKFYNIHTSVKISEAIIAGIGSFGNIYVSATDGATPMPTTMRVANVMDENPHKRVVRCRHLRVRAQLPGLGLGLGLGLESPLSLRCVYDRCHSS